MRVVMLCPRRQVNEDRERLWEFCREWWRESTSWPIFEGYHWPDEGPFNRSMAVNRAALFADLTVPSDEARQTIDPWDVAVVIDGDVVAPIEQVHEAVKRAHDTGRCTLAYDEYVALNREMTHRVVDGYSGDWDWRPAMRMKDHVSSIVVVSRRLWDEVGGFDERFEGWGFEDGAFIRACRVLGGGIERVEGTVWHLWHPTSAERNPHAVEHTMGRALLERYIEIVEPERMAWHIYQRDQDGLLLMVMTDGRRDCIVQAIASAKEHLGGDLFTRRVIHDDSGDEEYQAWLRHEFPGFEVIGGPKRVGYAAAMTRARAVALMSGERHVFWLEDDFVFNEPVDLGVMRSYLDADRQLAQLALLRQPWYEAEVRAGGVLSRFNLDQFEQHDGYFTHQLFWTCNPSLVPRRFLAQRWPAASGSEARFGRLLFGQGYRAGYLGKIHGPPVVQHIGAERAGRGY
jgi:GT2 family glycosyltransferase